MPLGFVRLNERHQRPNEYINFIKPLKGPDEAVSLDFLERLAAICQPICKTNHLSVMSLEEHEPNREFLGRNWNNGEVIELVLKSRSGTWLPFRFVQMVLMHELAHCKQMNHSRAFWKVKDQYAAELRDLWQKNYTGDGVWSTGRTLYEGQHQVDDMPPDIDMAEALCGGMYRSKRKRKPKPNMSYAERKERRIKRKFGEGGVALGGSEETRQKLENGRYVKGQPRAKGVRGRELRAAAALARFQGQSTHEKPEESQEEQQDQSGEGSDGGDDFPDSEAVVDSKGRRMLDRNGLPVFKVKEDQAEAGGVKNELKDMLCIDHYFKPKACQASEISIQEAIIIE